jgi:hypothetical protein
MAQFSLKRFFTSLTMIALGIGIFVTGFSYSHPPLAHNPQPPTIVTIALMALALSPGPLIGAGILNFFGRAGLGAIIGILAWGGFIVICAAMNSGI